MGPKAVFRTRWPGAVLEALVKSNEILRPFDRDFSRAILLFWLQCRQKVPFSFLVNWSPAGSILVEEVPRLPAVPVWWGKCLDWSPAGPMLVGKVPRLIPLWSKFEKFAAKYCKFEINWQVDFFGKNCKEIGFWVQKKASRLYRLAGLAKARPALKIQIFQTSGPKSDFQDALTRSSFRSSRQVQWNPQTIW